MRSCRSWWRGLLLVAITLARGRTASTAPPAASSQSCGQPPCTFVAFGPQGFTRDAGGPQQETAAFSVANPAASFTLHVDSRFVASATVWLNGAVVLSPADFNANVRTLDRAVRLEAQNTLAVELRSRPGATLTAQVIGVDADAPVITYEERGGDPPNAN